MKRRRKTAMGKRLQAIADAPGIIDSNCINVWTEDAEGNPKSEAGRQASIAYVRADGGKRLNGQKRAAW